MRATLEKPKIAALVKPYKAGRLVNELKELAENIQALPRVERSSDPDDDYLLALAKGQADYLALGRHKSMRIITAREFAALFHEPEKTRDMLRDCPFATPYRMRPFISPASEQHECPIVRRSH